MLQLFLLLFVYVSVHASRGKECKKGELPCIDEKKCISVMEWCDSIYHCSDGSDEYFCSGHAQCPPELGLFRCRNGVCIPKAGRCDGFPTCQDESDEEGCIGRKQTAVDEDLVQTLGINPNPNLPPVQESESNIREAVVAAAKFLLDQRQADYGWGSAVATSRAVVALAFAERIYPLGESEKQLMKKQLNIQLALDLLQIPMKTSLSHLALYINALYATCQNPRSFQDLNLVEILRNESEKVPNFNLPIVLLTLCVTGEKDANNVRMEQLRNIYLSSDRISTQALALRAWDCYARKQGDSRYFKEYVSYLKNLATKMVNLTESNLDVYSTALYFQAYNAAVLKSNISMLISHSRRNESFGDLLATYYAIPALLNATLMELDCSASTLNEVSTENTYRLYSGGKIVTYSLWIPTDASVNTRTVTVNYGGQATFYDIMRMAESKDPTYRFMYDIKDGNIKIYSIADTPNDSETGKYWTLYQSYGELAVNSERNLSKLRSEVNLIHPEDGAHYIFWLKRGQDLVM